LKQAILPGFYGCTHNTQNTILSYDKNKDYAPYLTVLLCNIVGLYAALCIAVEKIIINCGRGYRLIALLNLQ